MRKILILLLGGILTMSLLTGCESESDYLGKFGETISIFDVEELSDLYERSPRYIWSVGSYINYRENGTLHSIGVVIWLKNDTKEAKGEFIMNQYRNGDIVRQSYPIYYDKEGFHFTEEVSDEEVINKFNDFKMMFEVCDINIDYLKTLKLKEKSYSSISGIRKMRYEIPVDDKNLEKIKELYPQYMKEDDNKATFQLYSSGMQDSGTITFESNNEYDFKIKSSCQLRSDGAGLEYFK